MPAKNKTVEKTVEQVIVEPPKMWNVVFHNDDETPMGVVVDILSSVFNKNDRDAYAIMISVHVNGTGVAGTYLKSIADSKAEIGMNHARQMNFPLRITVEASE